MDETRDEVGRLQACINDLISVLALPAMWSGQDSAQIVNALLDVLLGMLRLDFAYVRIRDPGGDAPMQTVRLAQSRNSTARPHEISEVLKRWLEDDPKTRPPRVRSPDGHGDVSIVPLRLGLQDEIGVIVAGSRRAGFPSRTERLLLSVAANQAAIGLQEARILTEQKRLARELDQRVMERTRELAAANEVLEKLRSDLAHVARVTMLGALTASIAHEVNQPLSGIVTNASTCLRMLAADPPNVEGARETARRTIRDGNRAAEVIARLRALFSRNGTAADSVDLNEATEEVLALASAELQRSGVNVRTELACDLPPVTGDRVQLQQVILNLLLNASEAMTEVEDRLRQVVIRTERDEPDGVRLTVQDAGVGFDPRLADRIFDAFYTTKSVGMGIGLSVSRSIIEGHHGRLWAVPNEGPGATFAFSLPGAGG